jgi:dienelactone hydrolase
MNVHEVPSAFFGETAIFYYPAIENTNQAILVLKGLYGQHIPVGTQGKQSWDNQLVDLLKNKYEVFIFNTGMRAAEEKKEAFAGKTFQQECDDVRNAFTYCKESILQGDTIWGSVAMSFGGTILMGCPDILQAMRAVVMIGSGCGKSPTTTKPLLSTLPDTADLLKSISNYTRSLYFLHGGKDTVVPRESQMKIHESATKCFSRGWIEFPILDHELNNPEDGASYTATAAEKFLTLAFTRFSDI